MIAAMRELGGRAAQSLLAVAALALLPASTARAASLWKPLQAGTTGTISAIAAPKQGEVVFATTAGEIHHREAGGAFAAASVTPADPSGFTDLAMSPDGASGVAVGPTGAIYRSVDAGVSWTQVTGTQEYGNYCGAFGEATLEPLKDNLYSVAFADGSTVYVTGAKDDVLRSTDDGASFTEVNKHADGSCVADPGGGEQAFTDTAWLSASTGFLLSNYFGTYFATTDAFTTAPHKTGESGGVNGFQGIDRLALDQSDPTRAWATNPGQGVSYLQYTIDGGASWSSPSYEPESVSLQDISFSGGTVIAVGLGGDIVVSANGRDFALRAAPAPYTGNDWHAVAVLSKTTAFVGGAGGALLETTEADAAPGSAPPQSGSGSPSVSKPVSKSSGGSTITIYRKVAVSHSKRRYIPVRLSTKRPRRFVITLEPAKSRRKAHRRVLARLRIKLRKGHRTVHLRVSKKVRSGRYRLVVRVYRATKRSRQVGKTVKQVFVLS